MLAAAFAVLAGAAGAGGIPQALGPGILVSNLTSAPGVGVYRITPGGGVHQIVGLDLIPRAAAPTGAAAGFRAGDRDGKQGLILARRKIQVQLPHSSSGVGCVAFSADGSLIAYVSGEPTLTHASSGIQYFRIEGTLWLADVSNPEEARAIETGAFATSECPLPSPSGQKFAYFVQKAPDVAWELHVYRDGQVSTIADDPVPVPSNHDRSFAWSPNGETLAFIRGDDLFTRQGHVSGGLTKLLAPRSDTRYARALDFSSDGRLLAVSFGFRTGIFRLNGRLVRVVFGHLREWSGSRGVLTEGLDSHFAPTLFRFPLRGPRRSIARHFKLAVVSDPAGAWFAYPESRGRQLVFRRADGSLLRRIQLSFTPAPLAATDRLGRLSLPAGSY
jgi:WD40-like Beta Propeller Repeat